MGVVVAACIGRPGELWKQPVEGGALVERFGFAGDRHAGEMRPTHNDPQVIKPNERQVTLMAREVELEIERELGVPLRPGSFGENICVEGLGDLSAVQPGALVRTDRGVVLRITAQNDPCDNLMEHHRLLVKKAYGRRGLLATVMSGAGLLVAPGDRIEILPAAEGS